MTFVKSVVVYEIAGDATALPAASRAVALKKYVSLTDSGVRSLNEIPGFVAATSVTGNDAVIPPAEAVMVAVPALTARTTPLLVTVALPASLDVHVVVVGAGEPVDVSSDARSCVVSPTSTTEPPAIR